MNINFLKTLVCGAALCFCTTSAVQAQALEILNPPIKVETKKKSSGSKAKFDSGSAETKKERSARLSRECKGQVNAGACAGYTR